LVDSIHSRMSLVRRDGTKAIDQAAGTAMSIPRRVEPPARITEFHRNRI
jgi:hypothetical protein